MRRLVCILAAAGPLLLAGCKQDAGERCQVDSDCGGGLVCCPPGAGEGTCHADCTSVSGEGEAEAESEGEDAGVVDAPAGEDLGSAVDASDAAPVDVMPEPTID